MSLKLLLDCLPFPNSQELVLTPVLALHDPGSGHTAGWARKGHPTQLGQPVCLSWKLLIGIKTAQFGLGGYIE